MSESSALIEVSPPSWLLSLEFVVPGTRGMSRLILSWGVVAVACLLACGARTSLVLDLDLGGQDAGRGAGGDSSMEGPPATPRAIAPLSTATVTSQIPLLRWELSTGDDGAAVDLCRDRACTTPLTSFRASGTSGAPPIALSAGVYYWRLHGVRNGVVGAQTSPVWEFFVGGRSAPINTSWGTTLDVNGDGYADIVVGAGGSGAVYLYLGGADGPSTPPVRLAHVGSFGGSVASAGDVNGDGFADLIVGADQPAGGAYLYLGGEGGLLPTAVMVSKPAGPDGYFGGPVASAGDVNGDGFADVIVGAYIAGPGNEGAAYVYLGGAAGLSTTPLVLTAPAGRISLVQQFGISVASAGDVNGDGFADVVVGAYDRGGAAYLYLGGAGGLGVTPSVLSGAAMQSQTYAGAGSAGDVNGDGYADLLVGVSGVFGEDHYPGAAYVYLGGPAGPEAAPIALTSHGVSGLVAGAGDVNGDGFADVMAADDEANDYAGAVYVYLGGTGGPSTTPTTTLTNAALPAPNAGLGTAIASAGDVNGDGYADILVGALDGADAYAGAAFVYGGGAGGPSTNPTALTGPQVPNGYFGYSLATAGELSGARPHDSAISSVHTLKLLSVFAPRAARFGGDTVRCALRLDRDGCRRARAKFACLGTTDPCRAKLANDVVSPALQDSAGQERADRASAHRHTRRIRQPADRDGNGRIRRRTVAELSVRVVPPALNGTGREHRAYRIVTERNGRCSCQPLDLHR